MPSPAQTPVIFAKAGNTDFVFSGDCVVALLNCGYSPKDFGTYTDVQDRIKEAKENVKTYESSPADQESEITGCHREHEEFVATAQSGHIYQNARFVKGGSRKEGGPCNNVYPLYDHDLAPCMPHSSYLTGSRGGARSGSAHRDIGRTDDENNVAAGTPNMTDQQVHNAAKDVTKIALTDNFKNSKKSDNQKLSDVLKKKKKASAAALSAEAANVEGVTDASKDYGLDEEGNPNDKTVDKAMECIEAFCEHCFKEMRKAGQDKAAAINKTPQQAAADAAAATEARKAAEAKAGKAKTAKEREQAKKDVEDAKAAEKKACDEKCVVDQAASIKDPNSVEPFGARNPKHKPPPRSNSGQRSNGAKSK